MYTVNPDILALIEQKMKAVEKLLRTRLYNAATVAVLHPNQFQSYFQKKKTEGKPYRVALVANMNKMTRVIHAVWSKNEPYREPGGDRL